MFQLSKCSSLRFLNAHLYWRSAAPLVFSLSELNTKNTFLGREGVFFLAVLLNCLSKTNIVKYDSGFKFDTY